MSRKALLIIAVGVIMMAFGVWGVSGQDGGDERQPEEVPIFTTATDAVGVGTYVAAQAWGFPAGEDPAEDPVLAYILPYAIYPDMHVAMIEDFEQPAPLTEDLTFEWSLVAPEDSMTELMDGNVAIFMADVEGVYELTLTATDADGNVGEETWVVYATTYVGSGYLDGPEDEQTQCIDCHEDYAEGWMATRHSMTFVDTLNGDLSDHFGPDCVYCHTTGFNNRPEAVNGGFDDLAAEHGWTLPEDLMAGGWDAFVEEYPEVAAMANVQCESCHGPGYLHVFEATRRESMIGTGLAYGTCAQCHAEEPYLTVPLQWEASGHADITSRSFTYPIGPERGSCVQCHSGVGFIDFAAGLPQDELRTDYQPITCAVCHDPHNVENPNQLRVFDTVLLPDGTDVADAGASATCMSCHNARRDANATVQGAVEGGRFSTPHYSTAGELMNSTGGYTWGEDVPTTTHGTVLEDSCIDCHMSTSPGRDADGNPLPGHNTVGGHSFAMVDDDGFEHIDACQSCHDNTTSFDFEAFRDYDGDGTIESNREEIAGLRELLEGALVEAGVGVLDHHPYFEIPEGADENTYGAVWNLKFTESGGSAVHNLRYTVGLLQLSYERLMGEPVPGAYILE